MSMLKVITGQEQPNGRLVDRIDHPYNFFIGGSVKVYPLHQVYEEKPAPRFSTWNPVMDPQTRKGVNRYTKGEAPERQIYIHIPFCPAFCHFCILYKTQEPSQQGGDYRERFVQALLKEIEGYGRLESVRARKTSAIYFGGGTPSMLTNEQVQRILDALAKHIPLTESPEVTFEGMPHQLKDLDYLAGLKACGVNRISYGIQTFQPELRQQLGRIDTAKDIEECAANVLKADIQELNVELLFGIPGMTQRKLTDDVNRAVGLGCNTLDLLYYNATPGTQYYDLIKSGVRPPQIAGNELLEMRLRSMDFLKGQGFTHTAGEIFDRDGERYDRFQETHYGGTFGLDEIIGLGPSSYGFLDGVVYQNVPSVARYNDLIERERFPLRTHHQIDTKVAQRRGILFGIQLFKVHKALITSPLHRMLFRRWSKLGLVQDGGAHWHLTEQGRIWYNLMQLEIVPPTEGRAAFDMLIDADEQDRLLFNPRETVGNVGLVRQLEAFIEGDVPLLKPIRRFFFQNYSRIQQSRGKVGSKDFVRIVEKGQNAFTTTN